MTLYATAPTRSFSKDLYRSLYHTTALTPALYLSKPSNEWMTSDSTCSTFSME